MRPKAKIESAGESQWKFNRSIVIWMWRQSLCNSLKITELYFQNTVRSKIRHTRDLVQHTGPLSLKNAYSRCNIASGMIQARYPNVISTNTAPDWITYESNSITIPPLHLTSSRTVIASLNNLSLPPCSVYISPSSLLCWQWMMW
jgi:hypothetical protein